MPFVRIEPGQEMPAPSICVLCESSRSGREGEDFFVSEVGELDDAALGFGRKIVCQRCATELGHEVGMEVTHDVEHAVGLAEAAERAMKDFRKQVSDIAKQLVEAEKAAPRPEKPASRARKPHHWKPQE